MNFTPLTIDTGLLLDLSSDPFPTKVHAWKGAALKLPDGATHYGIVTEGESMVTGPQGEFRLRAGMFFSWPDGCTVGGRGAGLVISRLGFRGLWQLGGPLEARGRLEYIDGCTDTLLVCPPLQGDPCLNHLHIPPHTNQSPHTHPSERIGVILRGSGECRTPDGAFPLSPGMGWRIPAGQLHSFYTGDDSLDVVAWHPDSDFGPTDANHPMRNRTILATGPGGSGHPAERA